MWVVHWVVSRAADMLEMSVVCGMRGVGGVYVFGSGRRMWRGEWMRGLCIALTIPVGTWGVLDVCLCLGCGGVGWVHPLFNPVAPYLPLTVYLFMVDIANCV